MEEQAGRVSVPAPTEEDVARDAAADLAVCEAATPGLIQDGYAVLKELPPGRVGCIDVAVFSVWDGGECALMGVTSSPHRANAGFLVLAREALPAWIRRCVAAEAKVRAYDNLMDAIVSLQPHRGNTDVPHVEALLDWVDRAKAAEAEVARLRRACGLGCRESLAKMTPAGLDAAVLSILREAGSPLSMRELEVEFGGHLDNFDVRDSVWRLVNKGLADFTPSREVVAVDAAGEPPPKPPRTPERIESRIESRLEEAARALEEHRRTLMDAMSDAVAKLRKMIKGGA